MEKTYRIILSWSPAIVWMIVIFFFSSHQSVTVSPQYVLNFFFFKTLHVIEYAILFVLNTRATQSYRSAFIVTVLYAMTDELHQQFVPSREGKPRDVIIDAIGAGIAWYFLTKLLPKAPKKHKKWVSRLGLPKGA